jgi:hypothetical protein
LKIFKPKVSTKPRNYPSWASWRSKEVYLPPAFHSLESFNKALVILKDVFLDPSVFEGQNLEAPLLLLGLIFREVSRAMEIEPGEPTSYPMQLVHSPLGIAEMQKIEEMLNDVNLPSQM